MEWSGVEWSGVEWGDVTNFIMLLINGAHQTDDGFDIRNSNSNQRFFQITSLITRGQGYMSRSRLML